MNSNTAREDHVWTRAVVSADTVHGRNGPVFPRQMLNTKFMIRHTLAIALLLTMPCYAQEQYTKTFAIGDLAFLEQPESCGWLCFDRQVSSERDGKRCYLQLERVGTFKVAALSKSNVGDVAAYYTITVTDGKPGPTPVPPGPTPPGPTPVPPGPAPTDWQAKVTAMTRQLPADALSIASQVSQVFSSVASRCGQDLFTGPEIRAAIDEAVAKLPGFSNRWNGWSADWRMETAKWANEKYRDAAAYRERCEQTAAGIHAAIPAAAAAPPVTAAPLEGVRVAIQPSRHQIRGGKLYEYRCPQNGRRCSWVGVGTVLERGTGWVIVQ